MPQLFVLMLFHVCFFILFIRAVSKIVFFIDLGIDLYTKVINIGDERVRLQIWY